VQRQPIGPFLLDDSIAFPPVHRADDQGLLAIGGDLSVKRLLAAYRSAIFPWPLEEGMPMFWWSPDPRFVLYPDELRVPRSLRSRMRRGDLQVRCDTAFRAVMEGCSEASRPDQEGTWITEPMIEGYVALHKAGHAHSIETWQDDELVGGFYGVTMGDLFCGESMFARVSDASKVAFARFVQTGWFRLIDCQLHTDHLERFGAREIARTEYLEELDRSLSRPQLLQNFERVGSWADAEM
jgi:leucyl/phenylalanyl-tRNA--protein transferase